jgi:hypothetical protein
MKRLLLTLALFAVWPGASQSQAGVKPEPVFVVDRPPFWLFFIQ